jgi:hypothetical protein
VIIRKLLLSTIAFAPVLSYSHGCDMNSRSNTELPPLLGTMAGVELSFPRTKYGYPYIHYGNAKDGWGANPTRSDPLPTQQSAIRDFIITLNRSTFRPVCTKEDVDSYALNFRPYGDANLPDESSRWLEFIFSPRLQSQSRPQLKGYYEEQVVASTRLLGPLIPRPDSFGLRSVSANREGGPYRKSEMHDVYDTWYLDDSSWRTLISCTHYSESRTPLKLSCVHYFVVPELNAVAHGGYMAMADVSDWKRIEKEFRERVLSYLVKNPPK